MAYSKPMTHTDAISATQSSLQLTQHHYENFPVASVFLPQHLRAPIALIYSFARQADDFADEGDFSDDERLNKLQNFRNELDLIQAYIQPNLALFKALSQLIKTHQLPLSLFYDLLDAFSQDVTKTRYTDFEEILDYCRRSAIPIGRLLLHLYRQATPQHLVWSDNICSALQLINFYQDIAIDLKKNNGKQRLYLCQDELKRFGLSDTMLQTQANSVEWAKFMHFNIDRAERMLHSGKPLGRVLPGRIGFELRLIVAGGQCIIDKLKQNPDVFTHRPILSKWDWCRMFFSALFKR